MADCTAEMIGFPSVKKRRIEANFGGGEVSSNGGVLLLRQTSSSAHPRHNDKQRGKGMTRPKLSKGVLSKASIP